MMGRPKSTSVVSRRCVVQCALIAACWCGRRGRRTGPTAAGLFPPMGDPPMRGRPESLLPPTDVDSSGQQGSPLGFEGPEVTLSPLLATMGLGLARGGVGQALPRVARGTGWESPPAGVGG